MKIKAAVLTAPNTPFVIDNVELDAPQAGEVRVRVAAVGVCHSDWHLVTGATKHPMPVVAGHEGAGVVEAVGPGVSELVVGDHVILNWAPSCGECFYCLHGRPSLCDTYTAPLWAGTMLDGSTRLRWRDDPLFSYCGLASFASHTVVPEQCCVKIRKDVPLESAALVGCAVATGVGASVYTAQVRPGESVAVIGCGGVGLNCIQGAAICGASTIIAIDVSESKLKLARTLGATDAILSDEKPQHPRPAAQRVQELVGARTDGRGVDHAFEAVGIPALQELAFAITRPGGTATLAGLSAMGSATNLPGALIVRQEKTIKGSYYGTVNARRDFPMLVELYLAGRLKLDELIEKRVPLERINEAYEALVSGKSVGRWVITFDQ